MFIKHCEYINEDYRATLLPMLEGRVFHLTTETAFGQIQNDATVYHNKNGTFPLNTSSHGSYGRQNGWVCLFDLRSHSKQIIDEALTKYNFLRPAWFITSNDISRCTETNLAYLFVNPCKYVDIIPNSFEKEFKHFVPKVECWYPGDMPIDYIEEVLIVRIVQKFTLADELCCILENNKQKDTN